MPPPMASPRKDDSNSARSPQKNGTKMLTVAKVNTRETHQSDEEESRGDLSSDGERTRSVRAVRNRLQVVDRSESESESATSSPPRPRRRLSRGVKEQSARNGGTSSPPSEERPKRSRGRPRRIDNDAAEPTPTETDVDYVHIQVGDCVLLDSGDADDHFVALVSSVQLSQSSTKPTGFTAQWYYKPEDIPDDVRATIEGSILPNEVFLSPHKDRNSVDAVIGLCNVVGYEEHLEMEADIGRGFREKSAWPYFVCRFKYYPSRPPKKALEQLKDDEIRGGLGPQKPKVGEEFQAAIPDLLPAKPTGGDDGLPWRSNAATTPGKAIQVWSRHVVSSQEQVFRHFRLLLDTLRYGVGNVVRVYRNNHEGSGHLRCIVLKSAPGDVVDVCLSTGEVKQVLKGQLLSPFADDLAYKVLYTSRFNLPRAIFMCSKELLVIDHREREAFKQEVAIFTEIAANESASTSDIKKQRT